MSLRAVGGEAIMFAPLVLIVLAIGQVQPGPSSLSGGTATLGAPMSSDLMPTLPSGAPAANSSLGVQNSSGASGPALPTTPSSGPPGNPHSLNSPYNVPNGSPAG